MIEDKSFTYIFVSNGKSLQKQGSKIFKSLLSLGGSSNNVEKMCAALEVDILHVYFEISRHISVLFWTSS